MAIRIDMFVIPEPDPDTRLVFVSEGIRDRPYFSHGPQVAGEIDLVCGGCGHVLIEGAPSVQNFVNMVLKCPQCGEFNETRA